MTARPLTEQDLRRNLQMVGGDAETPEEKDAAWDAIEQDWLRLSRLVEAFEQACGTNVPEVARHMIKALAEDASAARAEVSELRHTIERVYWLTLPGTAIHEELAAALASHEPADTEESCGCFSPASCVHAQRRMG